jgi:hypothetical protein
MVADIFVWQALGAEALFNTVHCSLFSGSIGLKSRYQHPLNGLKIQVLQAKYPLLYISRYMQQ